MAQQPASTSSVPAPAPSAAEIAATQASPVSFVSKLAEELGPNAIITRKEFFERGAKAFDLGSSVSGKVMTADELRKALSLNR